MSSSIRRKNMMQKCLITASLLVFIVSPALAAEYYVAHKPPKKEAPA